MSNNINEVAAGTEPVKTLWQWRSNRWIIALIILAAILIAGRVVIHFLDGERLWNANFHIIVLILFAVWTVFYEREWQVWKRVLWVIGLWFAVGVMPSTPFVLILSAMAMRRSIFFVEQADPALPGNETTQTAA
jgi:hypothetical protein